MKYTLMDIVNAIKEIKGVDVIEYATETYDLTDTHINRNLHYIEQIVHCRVSDRSIANSIGSIMAQHYRGQYAVWVINGVTFGSEDEASSIYIDEDEDVMICYEKPTPDIMFNCVNHKVMTNKTDILPNEFWVVKSNLKLLESSND